MKLYLQIGHGMQEHTRELLTRWGGGGAILSPRDLTETQLCKLAGDIVKRGGEPLIDPQCYVRDADHEKLVAHEYWKSIRTHATGAFTGGPGTDSLLADLAALAKSASIHTHILPAPLAAPVDDVWLDAQAALIAAARKHYKGDQLLATIAISSDALRNDDQMEAVVDNAEQWDVDGYYLVAEGPAGYLVDDPVWVANLLILASGLKLHGRRVIVGYAHHQLLCLAAANVDAIACGTYLNVRAFDTDKFFERDEDEISRRAIWYYAPESLSEYKLQFLDLAMRAGVLDRLRPPKRYTRDYSDPLFAGVQPSLVGWKEPDAFRHYLDTLKQQTDESCLASFEETADEYEKRLDRAQKLMAALKKEGIRGQDRDFADYVDVNQAAIARLRAARGPRLRRRW